MSDAELFRDLMARVRAGDERAAEELVRRYEATVRLAVRVRLDQSELRRLFDSTDICQSVLGTFFVRAASGQFELDTPEQLVKLLVTMARNKLINHTQQQRAARRDSRRIQGGVETADPADTDPSPSRVVAARELLQEFRSRLSEDERGLADLRAQGHSWAEIAAEIGGHPDALRFRLTRALDRVAGQLHLSD